VPFPPTAERFERMVETIEICNQMWSDNDGPYRGKHYELEATLCRPRPVSTPRPRILIGGGGERKTLRLVAEHADACNLIGDPNVVAHKIDVLRRHCDAVGRDINEIEITAMFRNLPPEPTVDDVVRSAEEFAELGLSTLVTGAIGDDPGGWLESTLGPAVRRLAAVEPARG
jgi:alkanesulfonate monooxygenase SsuD/methylene tetrahydromethanopterin reductase-like flavin-dependent oxidoreductase (luciferase family)